MLTDSALFIFGSGYLNNANRAPPATSAEHQVPTAESSCRSEAPSRFNRLTAEVPRTLEHRYETVQLPDMPGAARGASASRSLRGQHAIGTADTANGRAPEVSATVLARPTQRQAPDVVSRPQMNIESRRLSKNTASMTHILVARDR